jgi:aryl-alcohol dehydrogenase-like predicted oxidoreductase
MLQGFATPEGTARYAARFPQLHAAGHFRRPAGVPGVSELWLSSIGLGTYLGETTDAADAAYTAAIKLALRSGINVLDTAINYRHQRSERNIGAALEQLVEDGELRRDEVLVCTKAGFLTFDANMPPDPRAYFMREYVEPGILDPSELAGGMHCIAPKYLANQLERSRTNLRLETIDVFYVHNPESQLGDLPAQVFRERLLAAFIMLEEAVRAGKVRFYGTATWSAYRLAPGQREYVSLAEVVEIARQAGGEDHHFRFVQLPFNLGMPEAYALKNQAWDGQPVSVMDLAARAGVAIVGSATLHQGQLTRDLPEFIREKLGTESDTESAVQFARSAPGLATALIGMGREEHVRANAEIAARPLVERQKWESLFRRD